VCSDVSGVTAHNITVEEVPLIAMPLICDRTEIGNCSNSPTSATCQAVAIIANPVTRASATT